VPVIALKWWSAGEGLGRILGRGLCPLSKNIFIYITGEGFEDGAVPPPQKKYFYLYNFYAVPLIRKKLCAQNNNFAFHNNSNNFLCILTQYSTVSHFNAHPQSRGPTSKLFFQFTCFFGCFIMCILCSPSGECSSTNGLSTGNRISHQWAPHW